MIWSGLLLLAYIVYHLLQFTLLKTDPSYIERTARSKLNLARPNETIFRFESPASNAPTAKR